MLMEPIVFGFSIYQIFWLFCIYSILGWLLEVVFCTVTSGKFVNRGFLNGPVCPIYGFGAVIVILALEPISDNLFILFFGGMLLTSLLELVTGFVMEKLFKTRWWDYSSEPFNIGGYICLTFSLAWGVACVVLMRVIHPLILNFVNWAPEFVGKVLLLPMLTYFLIDLTVTILTVNSMNRDIARLDELKTLLRKPSDEIAGGIYEGFQKTQQEQEELIAKRSAARARLAKAFPKLRSVIYKETLSEYLERLLEDRRNKKENLIEENTENEE